MRLLLGITVALLLLTSALQAGEKDPRDAPNVKKIRERLKTTKVTVEYQDTMLKDVVADLKEKTSLGIEILSGKGVSANQPITYKAKDKPLDVVLDQMFKPNDLGYVIGRKRHGRYAGWILIEKGPYRGDDDEDMPDKSASTKDKKGNPKKMAKRKPPADEQPMDDAAKAEQRAEVKYQIAQELANDGKVAQAKERLEDLIKTWPSTKAAAKAKTLLQKLSQ